jgi:hypothetical protein
MHNPGTVSLIERVSDLHGQAERLIDPDRPSFKSLSQRLALNVFQDKEVTTVFVENVVDGTDVWMRQLDNRLSVTLKAHFQFGIRGPQLFDHRRLAAARLPRAEDPRLVGSRAGDEMIDVMIPPHECSRLYSVQRRRARGGGRVRGVRRAPRHRGSQLHLRRPQDRQAPWRAVLNHEELQSGDVSLEYVSRLMNRRYTDSPAIRKVLQTIWYQVNNGQEIYVVGTVLPDGTVRGGTGWGAEFAKLCNKPLHVFDQEKDRWFTWIGTEWQPRPASDSPVIAHPHFTGTGTRTIQENSRAAIEVLFTRSFGAA